MQQLAPQAPQPRCWVLQRTSYTSPARIGFGLLVCVVRLAVEGSSSVSMVAAQREEACAEAKRLAPRLAPATRMCEVPVLDVRHASHACRGVRALDTAQSVAAWRRCGDDTTVCSRLDASGGETVQSALILRAWDGGACVRVPTSCVPIPHTTACPHHTSAQRNPFTWAPFSALVAPCRLSL